MCKLYNKIILTNNIPWYNDQKFCAAVKTVAMSVVKCKMGSSCEEEEILKGGVDLSNVVKVDRNIKGE